jgi:hypothetical protein
MGIPQSRNGSSLGAAPDRDKEQKRGRPSGRIPSKNLRTIPTPLLKVNPLIFTAAGPGFSTPWKHFFHCVEKSRKVFPLRGKPRGYGPIRRRK